MADIAATVRTGLEKLGWLVRALETDPLSARLIVTDADSGEECEVDILKEALWRPPVTTEHGLVLSLEDVVGTKVRALADRGLARDLIDVKAAAGRWSLLDLEALGRRHARDTSTSRTCKRGSAEPTGSTTPNSPRTGSTTARQQNCASGHSHGRRTSPNDSTRHTTPTTNERGFDSRHPLHA